MSAYESGRREPSVPVLSRIVAAAGFAVAITLQPLEVEAPPPFVGPVGRRVQRRRAELRALLAERGFGHPEIFGSVARGDDRSDSDLDLLVDVPEGIGLLELARLQSDAASIAGVPVDLIPRDGLKPDVRENVSPDLVVL